MGTMSDDSISQRAGQPTPRTTQHVNASLLRPRHCGNLGDGGPGHEQYTQPPAFRTVLPRPTATGRSRAVDRGGPLARLDRKLYRPEHLHYPAPTELEG